MPAATLPFDNFNGIVAKDEVELSIEGHGDRHVSEKSLYTWHLAPYNIILEVM